MLVTDDAVEPRPTAMICILPVVVLNEPQAIDAADAELAAFPVTAAIAI
jgi:hypothetical protein